MRGKKNKATQVGGFVETAFRSTQAAGALAVFLDFAVVFLRLIHAWRRRRFSTLFDCFISLFTCRSDSDFVGRTMRMDSLRINFYLLPLLVALAIWGCQTSKSKDSVTHIELHVESNPDGTEHTEKILVNRASPLQLTVNHDAFLDTRYLTNAAVVESLGGYSIQLDFDKQGSWMLESATSMNTGKRVAVLALFPESRWLAAPLLMRRISNGRLTFTPDCNREEADRLVAGLNRTVAKLKKR